MIPLVDDDSVEGETKRHLPGIPVFAKAESERVGRFGVDASTQDFSSQLQLRSTLCNQRREEGSLPRTRTYVRTLVNKAYQLRQIVVFTQKPTQLVERHRHPNNHFRP